MASVVAQPAGSPELIAVNPEKLIFSTACETRRLSVYNQFPFTVEYKLVTHTESEFVVSQHEAQIRPHHRMDLIIRLVKPDVDFLNCVEKIQLRLRRKGEKEYFARRLISFVVKDTRKKTSEREDTPTNDNMHDDHAIATHTGQDKICRCTGRPIAVTPDYRKYARQFENTTTAADSANLPKHTSTAYRPLILACLLLAACLLCALPRPKQLSSDELMERVLAAGLAGKGVSIWNVGQQLAGVLIATSVYHLVFAWRHLLVFLLGSWFGALLMR